MQEQFLQMSKDQTHLFVTDIDKDVLWNTYLEGFEDPITKQEHNCNCCRSFIKNYSNIVSIKDGKLVTIWDLSLESLDKLAKSLNKQVKEDSEESFIKAKTTASKELDLAFELVKYVITVKLDEAEAKKITAEKRAKKAQIMELIGRKEIQSLENKSIEELTKELENL